MRFLTYLIAIIGTALIILFPLSRRLPQLSREYAVRELIHTAQIVEADIHDIQNRINDQLRGFASVVALDRDFAMKLIVERDTSATEVTEIAERYMPPMDFSVLEITTAGGLVLSSGHFPGQAGNITDEQVAILDSIAAFTTDNIKGRDVLTFQKRVGFEAAGTQFFCSGGLIADSSFVSMIRPRGEVGVILRHGGEVIGMDIQTMSEIDNNAIIINDKTYLATTITVPMAGPTGEVELILLMDEPRKVSLIDLFGGAQRDKDPSKT